MTSAANRLSTGVPGLDPLLGGGLLRGTLTVIVGATGIGKTQLGVHFLQAGLAQEGRPGVIFDLSSRMDSQNHAGYAQRMFNRPIPVADAEALRKVESVAAALASEGEYLKIFDRHARPVVSRESDSEGWDKWQADLNRNLAISVAFFYGHFCRGVRRVVIDGVEPTDRPEDSVQFELFEYIYHQVLRKEHDWLARDLFRQKYRAQAEAVAQRAYNHDEIGSLLLYTSHETLLERMIERGIDQGDLLSGANTVIYMGKVPQPGGRMARGLYVAKHRGSACSDDIHQYTIDDAGLHVS
jgi:hypothetical protein